MKAIAAMIKDEVMLMISAIAARAVAGGIRIPGVVVVTVVRSIGMIGIRAGHNKTTPGRLPRSLRATTLLRSIQSMSGMITRFSTKRFTTQNQRPHRRSRHLV